MTTADTPAPNLTPADLTLADPPHAPLPGPAQTRRFAGLRAIAALVIREMSTSYGRSPGGYIWAILEPVGGIALLSVVFSLALRNPALGSNFALFYATGLIPLSFFLTLSNQIGLSVLQSRQLLAYPSVTILDAILARFVLNLMTQLMVAFVVFAGIMLIFDTKVILNPTATAAALGLSAALALGVGTLNCYLFTQVPIWQNIWAILTRPLFLISCVFMVFDQLPAWARDWLWYNPIVHTVGTMRHGFYSTYHAQYTSPLYILAIALITATAGLVLIHKDKQNMLER